MKFRFQLSQLLLIVTIFAIALAMLGKWYRDSLHTSLKFESNVVGIEVWSDGVCLGTTPLQV